MAGINVIEWRDVTGTEVVHRFPDEGPGTVNLGAQLTVRESQTAVFFRDGQALDVFGPGRHTLTTLNLPFLQTLISLPFGGETPFQAEVYFVNMRIFTNLKWGTPTPIVFEDSEFKMIRLRAYGLYTMRVSQPQIFVNTVVGTEHVYDQASLNAWLLDFIISRFNDTLGEQVQTILHLPKVYRELAVAVRSKLVEDFGRYGIELVDFLVEAITPTEEVAAMIDERTSMEVAGDMGRFTQYTTARAIRDMPNAQGGAGGTAAAGVGLGAGVGIGAAMVSAMKGAFDPQAGGQQPAAQAQGATCPNCNAVVPAGSKFCPGCGKPLATSFCPECGGALPAGARFCPACGKDLQASPPAAPSA
jgi:membrane protease subunit (stomatin/prohibitin family)